MLSLGVFDEKDGQRDGTNRCVLREAAEGVVGVDEMCCFSQIDANKTSQVYDFFVKCGWVKSESAITTGASYSHGSASFAYDMPLAKV